MIDKFYAFVDKENQIILNDIETLPMNWRNICGLQFLSQTELKELGWYKITDPDLLEYSYTSSILEQFKYTIKDEIANLRWQAQTEAITFNGNTFVLNETTVNSLYQKRMTVANNTDVCYNWKTLDSIIQLSGSDIINLTDAIQNYIQLCFDIEVDFISAINSVQTLEDLLNLDYDISWPSTELT